MSSWAFYNAVRDAVAPNGGAGHWPRSTSNTPAYVAAHPSADPPTERRTAMTYIDIETAEWAANLLGYRPKPQPYTEAATGCPVRAECLAAGLAQGGRVSGIWGGLTGRELAAYGRGRLPRRAA